MNVDPKLKSETTSEVFMVFGETTWKKERC